MSNFSNLPIMRRIAQRALQYRLEKIEDLTKSDVITISGPIIPSLDISVLQALEQLDQDERNKKISVIIETPGGIVHIVEKMVTLIRRFYDHVTFIIPNEAMSAGTVFVLSGDEILMTYHSYLGPVDPQVYEEDRKALVPALSYLSQFEILNEKARNEEITDAELVLIENIDPGKLHQYGQERELTVELIETWLCQYKFKNWTHSKSTNKPVSDRHKQETAKEIARKLSNNELWHSHSRGIDLETLGSKVKLKVQDYSNNTDLYEEVKVYMLIVQEYTQVFTSSYFVQTREFIS